MGWFKDFLEGGLMGRGGQFLEGVSEFLQIAILNFTSQLLSDLLFNIYVQTERCCTTCYFSINSLLYHVMNKYV